MLEDWERFIENDKAIYIKQIIFYDEEAEKFEEWDEYDIIVYNRKLNRIINKHMSEHDIEYNLRMMNVYLNLEFSHPKIKYYQKMEKRFLLYLSKNI